MTKIVATLKQRLADNDAELEQSLIRIAVGLSVLTYLLVRNNSASYTGSLAALGVCTAFVIFS